MSIELAPLISGLRTKQITLTLQREPERSCSSVATKFTILLTVEDVAHGKS